MKGTPSSSSLEDDPEYGYMQTLVERDGFMRAMPPLNWLFKGHSMSSPVEPITFHLLELDLPADDADDRRQGPLRHRWNRKLLFHLTQEIIADLLHLDDHSASSSTRTHGPALLSKLWSTVKAFPAADCRVVGDIDALVALDLHATQFLCLRGLDDDTWTPFGCTLMFSGMNSTCYSFFSGMNSTCYSILL